LSADQVQLCLFPALASRLSRQYCFAPGAAARAAGTPPFVLSLPVAVQAHAVAAAMAAIVIFHIVASLG
jgi:hypothetical protein